MKRKKVIILSIILVLIIILLIGILYNTFAIDTGVMFPDNDFYEVSLKDTSTNTIGLAPGEAQTVIYKIRNDNNGTLNYGIGYSGNYVNVLAYDDSEDPATGTIQKNEYKYVKLRVENRSNSSTTANISVILGYLNGGSLIVPSGVTLVKSIFSPYRLTDYITELSNMVSSYENDPQGENLFGVALDNYLYKTSESYFNNNYGIRYFGYEPNNYIYFNCDNYYEQSPDTCELWRIIGVFNGQVKIVKFYDKQYDFNYSDLMPWTSNISGVSWGDSYFINFYYDNFLNDFSKSFVSSNGLWGAGEVDNQGYPTQIWAYENNVQHDIKSGILQVSDYMMASDVWNCSNDYLPNYGECISENWLFRRGINDSEPEWLSTIGCVYPTEPLYINIDGGVYFADDATNSYYYRHVLYLKPDVMINPDYLIGDFDNPFQIIP